MKYVIAILVALAPLAPLTAAQRPLAEAPAHGAATRVSLASLAQVSRSLDSSLQGFSAADPFEVLGLTRGIYLEGYGAVFTTELDLILTPRLSPFRPSMSDEEKAKVRARKLARVPAVERLINQMLQSAARQLPGVPDDEQIVVAIKFLYLPYEDTTGLPGQMVVKATRRAILGGTPIVALVSNQ
jgi:hypothetical protein